MELFINDEKEAIVRNIKFLLSSYSQTICFFRNFGLTVKYLDKPNPFQEMEVRSDIVEAIEKYEPRVEIDDLNFVYKDNKTIIEISIEYDGEIINVEYND